MVHTKETAYITRPILLNVGQQAKGCKDFCICIIHLREPKKLQHNKKKHHKQKPKHPSPTKLQHNKKTQTNKKTHTQVPLIFWIVVTEKFKLKGTSRGHLAQPPVKAMLTSKLHHATLGLIQSSSVKSWRMEIAPTNTILRALVKSLEAVHKISTAGTCICKQPCSITS